MFGKVLRTCLEGSEKEFGRFLLYFCLGFSYIFLGFSYMFLCFSYIFLGFSLYFPKFFLYFPIFAQANIGKAQIFVGIQQLGIRRHILLISFPSQGSTQENLGKYRDSLVFIGFSGFFLGFLTREGFPQIPSKYPLNLSILGPRNSIPHLLALTPASRPEKLTK